MKEQYPTVKVIFQRRKNDSVRKKFTVELEIYFKRKRKWISTGVRILPKHWNEKNRVVGLPDAMDANMKIESVERIVLNHIRQLMIEEKPFSWEGLNTVLNHAELESSFILFAEKRILSRKDIKETTRRNHKKLIVALREFKLINHFSDLVRGNIIKFDGWLRERKDYTQSTIASYHRYLKTYIHDAIRLELIKHDPYLGFHVSKGISETRKFLTPAELAMIENCKVMTYSLEKVKDMFLFQCYTGLSYSDMKKFDFQKVQDRGNRYILHDVRKKSSQDFYIVLLPPAIEILRKYNYQLPIISNEQYNMRLKVVAQSAGLDKPLTSHMGRHTFATMSLNSGVKIEVLAQMMGHSDIQTTQIYAKMVNSTVEEAYSVLETNEHTKAMITHLNAILSMLISALQST